MKVITSPELDYFCKNIDEICDKYKGQWIAIKGDKIVGYGDTLSESCEMAKSNGYEKFLTTRANKTMWNINFPNIF